MSVGAVLLFVASELWVSRLRHDDVYPFSTSSTELFRVSAHHGRRL